MAQCAGGQRSACVPGGIAPGPVDGCPALGEPGDRTALAGPRALSRRLSGQPARRGPQVLPALLPPRSRRTATRQPARREALSGRQLRPRLGFVVAGGALVVLIPVAFSVGRFPVPPVQLLAVMLSNLTGALHGLPASFDIRALN